MVRSSFRSFLSLSGFPPGARRKGSVVVGTQRALSSGQAGAGRRGSRAALVCAGAGAGRGRGAGLGPVGGLSRGPVCRPRRGGFFPRRRHIFALFGRNCKIRNTVVSALFLIRRGRAKGPTRMSSSAFSLAAPARPGGPPRAPGGPRAPRRPPRAPAGSRAPARRPGGGGGRILSPRSWRPPRPLVRIFAELPTGGIAPKTQKARPCRHALPVIIRIPAALCAGMLHIYSTFPAIARYFPDNARRPK